MSQSDSQPGRVAARRVILWVALIVALSLLTMTYGAFRTFDTAIQPEMEKRSRLIGVTVRDQFETAMGLGIPLASISGVEQFFEEILSDFADVQSIVLLAADGEVIADARREIAPGRGVVSRITNAGREDGAQFALPILSRNTLVGEIRIAFDATFVRTRLQDVLLDVFVVALVSILLAFELVIVVMAGSLGKPLDRIFSLLSQQAQGIFQSIIPAADSGHLRRIARRISDRSLDLADRAGAKVRPARLSQAYFVDIRLSLFVFSLATEISSAFMPLYSRNAGGPDWLTPDLAATLPLIAYLAAIAAVAPFSASITRRVAPKWLFLACIPLTAAALVGVGLGQSALWIAVWHGAMAVVYALATIACQEYATRTAPKGEMAQAIGSYLVVIMGGAFCGTALGGVLADRIGASSTFFFGAALVVVAGILGFATISADVSARAPAEPAEPAKDRSSGFAILKDPRYLALVLGVGAAINIGMSVFIWYLTPVILEASGARISDIGRTVMLFYLIPILLGPSVARLADERTGFVPMLICGAAISGIALSSLGLWSGFWAIVLVVACFGVGFSMCDGIQYAQCFRLADDCGSPQARDVGLAVLRLTNRLAAIAGLLSSAMLASRFDHVTLAVAIGALLLLGAALMLAVESSWALLRRRRMENS